MRIVKQTSPRDIREAAVRSVIEAREAEDKAKQRRLEAEANLASVLAEHELKSTTLRIGDTRYTTTVTSKATYTFNEPGLRRALTAKVYDKYTFRKLDTRKLKEAVEQGDIDAGVVAQYTETSYSQPFIKLTTREVPHE